MRQEKRWRYFCDFCRKSNGTKPAMVRHEKSCTANPNRECSLCALAGTGAHSAMELVAILDTGGFDALKAAAEDCPACILATYRLTNKGRDPEDCIWTPDGWDFRKELTAFWNRYNQSQAEGRNYG